MNNEREDQPHEGERAYNDERTRNPEAILSRVMRTRDEKPVPKVRFEDTADGKGCVTTGPNHCMGVDMASGESQHFETISNSDGEIVKITERGDGGSL